MLYKLKKGIGYACKFQGLLQVPCLAYPLSHKVNSSSMECFNSGETTLQQTILFKNSLKKQIYNMLDSI